jgi:hypothetical protein
MKVSLIIVISFISVDQQEHLLLLYRIHARVMNRDRGDQRSISIHHFDLQTHYRSVHSLFHYVCSLLYSRLFFPSRVVCVEVF